MADSDNILEIGALVNLGNLTSGFREMVSTVGSATKEMLVNFKELAVGVQEDSLKIVESVSEIGAKMSETAERTRLGVGTMEAGFAGLAGILGTGIAVGFAADFLDETARVLIELGHLNTTTQISVETLSGLRNVAQQNAIPFENLQIALARMQRAQIQALEGSKMYVQAFKDLGISVDDLRNLKPEDLFFRIAEGISKTTAPQIAMNSGITLMGRGVYTLIPLLEKYGTNLKTITEEAAKNSGVTEEAVKAAEQWHEETTKLSQMFQAGMVPVLTAIVNILPKAVALFDALGGTLIGTTAIFTTAFAAAYRLEEILFDIAELRWGHLSEDWNKFVHDMITGENQIKSNFDAAWNDINGVFRNPPPTTWFDKANQMMKDLGLNAPKFDLSGVENTTKKNDIVQRFREQLDELKDAEKGFHELSKNEEAQFWASKLAIVRGNVQAYRSVYHEFVAAERAAKHQALSEEIADMEQRLAAERAGSRQRIIILEEELNYLKRVGAEQTSEYRRVQDQLIVATREAATQEEREYVKGIETQLAAAKQNAAQKMAILNDALWFALNTYGLDSDAYKRFSEQKVEVDRQVTEQQRAIKAIDIDAEAEHAKAMLDIAKAAADTEISTNKNAKQRKLADTRTFGQQELDIERQLLTEKLALYRDDPVEYERIQKQLVTLTDKYTKQIVESVQKQNQQIWASYEKFNTQIESGFANSIAKMVETGRGFGATMAQLWNTMLINFVKTEAQRLAQFIIDHSLMLAEEKLFQNQSWILHLLGIGQKKTADAAAITATLTATQAANTAMTTSDAARTAAHVIGAGTRTTADLTSLNSVLPPTLATNVGIVTSEAGAAGAAGFASAMIALPFPVNISTAPGVMAAAIAAVMSNIGLAAAEKGALLKNDTFLVGHANELVIPSGISQGLQNVVAAGGFNPPPGLTQNFTHQSTSTAPVQNSVVHHHNISPRINVTVNGTSDGMKDLHNQVVETLKKAVRKGSLNFAEAS